MMKKFLAFSIAGAACAFVAGCMTPSATAPGEVFLPPPPEAKQYSDFLIGRYAYLNQNPALAAETASRAAKRDPEDGFLLERAVLFSLLAGETNDAVRLAKTGQSKADKLQAVTRLTLASDYFRRERYEDAREILSTDNFDLYNRVVSRSMSAWAAVGMDESEAARTHVIEALIGDDVLDGVNLFMLAFIQQSMGEEEDAIETFWTVWNERMRLAIACEQFARTLAAKGDTEAALVLTEQFRNEIGPNPAIDSLREDILAGKTIKAKPVSARTGASLSIYALAAALAAETREDDIASAYFELALFINPDLDLARTMLGNTLDQAGRREEAVYVLDDIKPSSPFYATSRGQLAWVLMRLDRDAEAIETAQEAFDKTGDRDLAIQIGDLNRAQENYDAAYRWFNKVVTEDEQAGREDWRAYYARGLAHDALDRWPDAERDLRRSLDIKPDQPQVLNYLGYSWVDRGENLEEAFNLIQQAVALSPQSGFIVDSLGWAHYKMGQYDEAVTYLERAVGLAANDPILNDHLGDAYWRAGKELQARFQWEHALNLNPTDEDAEKIRLKLEHGLDPLSDKAQKLVETDVNAETSVQ